MSEQSVVVHQAGEGPGTWAMGSLFEHLVSAEQTGGTLGMSLVTQPPGIATPLHRHTREAEACSCSRGSSSTAPVTSPTSYRRLVPLPAARRAARLPDPGHLTRPVRVAHRARRADGSLRRGGCARRRDARAGRGRGADDGRRDRPLERGRAALRPRGRRTSAAASSAGARRVATQVTLSAEESTNVRQRGPGPAPAPAPADPVRAASVRAIAEQLSTLRGPLLPVLHEVVATHGYVTDDDVLVVAEVLNLSRRRRARGRDLLPRPAPHSPGRAPGRAVPRRGLPGASAPRRCTPTATDRWAGSAAVEVGEVFCLGAVRRRAVRHRRRHACTPRCPPSGSTRSPRGGADDDRLGPVRRRRRRRSVRTPWPTPSRPPGSRCAATARAACCGSSRWSRSRPSAAGSATATSPRPRSAPLLDGALDDTDRCIGVVDEHDWLASPAPRVASPGSGSSSPTDLADVPRARRAGRAAARPVARPRRGRRRGHRRPGLRGRGGAGFPAGIKWETVRDGIRRR